MTGPRVSVIIPTLDEVDAISPLAIAVMRALDVARVSWEILIADGGSTDGTQAEARALESQGPVRLIEVRSGHGLAGDVLVAAREARADVVVVMDADGSHDPQMLPQLIQPVLDGTQDMAIGSRYVKGGQTPDWPGMRRFISRVAKLFAWPWVDVRDPTSGFFAVRRDRLLAVDAKAEGFKIGMEILLAAGEQLRVAEVPISFRDRTVGKSKMSAGQTTAYLRRLTALAGGAVTSNNVLRFALVGLLGLIVDMTVFQALWMMGLGLSASHILSFFVASATNYTLNTRWAFRATTSGRLRWIDYARFITVCLMALFLRGGVLALCAERLGWMPLAAMPIAILAAAVVNYLGCAFFVFPNLEASIGSTRWRTAAIGVIAYTLLLRLVYLGLPDLIPEEAYYWNYAQHPSLSYLDHPPMVAWLITAGTAMFGDTELGVRVGAYVCWLITAGFMFGLARHLFDKATALKTVMLTAALPFFFIFGFFTTPDSPLIACWAGSLFFLERALVGERRLAWWGFGVCLGLGMLSKYTIALLCPAALVFIVADRRSRRWLVRPEPYAAVLVAALLFTPVLVWNADNAWASFAFQSTQRLASDSKFALHVLVASILLLITPLGLIGAMEAIFTSKRWRGDHDRDGSVAVRRRLFTAAMTIAPLSVFVLFSLRYEPNLNWTGPLWLAVLPVVTWQMTSHSWLPVNGMQRFGQRLWTPTLAIVLLIFGGLLHYLTLGLPGVPYPGKMRLPIAWEEFGNSVELIENSLKEKLADPSHQEILVVGMDRYFIASELAFYRRDGNEGPQHTANSHLFGGTGLMYSRWYPADGNYGPTLILVSMSRDELTDERLLQWVKRVEPIQEQMIWKYGRPVLRYYYRVAQSYVSPNVAATKDDLPSRAALLGRG